MPPKPNDTSIPRTSYRHGDLRRALVDAATELARSGGPAAVVLRESTRRAGVAPNAAYRHFASREALLQAVRLTALGMVGRAMEAELARVPRTLQPADAARACLRAVGRGYLRFAQAEPGLFHTAFLASGVQLERPEAARPADAGPSPYGLLATALDRFVEAGLLTPARREGAEVLAWSAVHGLAMLVIDGPLAGAIPPKRLKQLEERLLAMVEIGLPA
jgi:AcrR family transcriptional regulator